MLAVESECLDKRGVKAEMSRTPHLPIKKQMVNYW